VAILLWGVLGVVALLVRALWRLVPPALEPLDEGAAVLAVYAASVLFNAYAEGYRGFQKQFAPRVVARAAWLRENPRPLLIVLAPVFCMGLIHATRKRLIVSWTLLLVIVGLVIGVRHIAQPWRGVIDAGVVVGLSWGLLALLVLLARAAGGRVPHVDPEVPTT
jgi:hypothetical protein